MRNRRFRFGVSDKKSIFSKVLNSSSKENKNLVKIELSQSIDSHNSNLSFSRSNERSEVYSNGASSQKIVSKDKSMRKYSNSFDEKDFPSFEKGNESKLLNSTFDDKLNMEMRREYNENNINDERYSKKTIYYTRQLSTDKKYKYLNVGKLMVTFVLGEFDDILPSYIFGNKHFSFSPHCCYQLANKNKGYIISFDNLIKRFKDQVIANDSKILYTYLFKQKRGKQRGIDIKIKDYKTLNSDGLINDGIINFYFKLIEDESLTISKSYDCYNKYHLNNFINKNKNNVLAMKSYFYNMLSNSQNEELSNYFSYPDSCSYNITKINIFKFKTMLVPICEKNHWSLIIVNNINTMHNIFDYIIRTKYRVSYVYEDLDFCDNNSSGIYPEIYYLDSYFGNDPRRINIILKYLFYEYQKIYLLKYGIGYPQFNLTNFIFTNHKKIQCYRPEVPKQNNKFDCGIFILLYTELFLYDPEFFFKYAKNSNQLGLISNNSFKQENNNTMGNNNVKYIINLNDVNEQKKNLLKFWFNKDLVITKRKNIQSLILDLSNLQEKYSHYDEGEDYYDDKLKDQDEIIEKYIADQKELYRQYFKKLEEERHL